MKIIVIGSPDLALVTAGGLAKTFGLSTMVNPVFKSSSLKNMPDAIYVTSALTHQQAKKMRPDLLVEVIPPATVHPNARMWKIVDVNTGETIKTRKNGFCDNLPYYTARRILEKLKLAKSDLNITLESYEAKTATRVD